MQIRASVCPRIVTPAVSSDWRLYDQQQVSAIDLYCLACSIVTVVAVSSAVDLLDVEGTLLNHPLARSAPYYDIVLRPGDMLYIPRWWWHYVTAVATPLADEWERDLEVARSQAADQCSSLPDGSVDDICIDDCVSWSINFWWGERRLKPLE